jgi:ferredoxin-NADP reductase
MRPAGSAARDRYHSLRVKDVVPETSDAMSIVFDVPRPLAGTFTYEAGQFVTLRVVIEDQVLLRSYSMSSAPSIDPDLQVTVKRVAGGVVSNWLLDHVGAGDVLEVGAPVGAFVLTPNDDELIAFAAGSGITPVFSLVKSALHTTTRRVRLLFANRDRPSAIFGPALDRLSAEHPDRLLVEHHEDVTRGFVTTTDVMDFVGSRPRADHYLCGPGGFMQVVEQALHDTEIDPRRIHVERFTPLPPADEPAASPAGETSDALSVTMTLGARTETVAQRGRSTILQSARFSGLPAQSSCESGHCATCMAQVLEGRVEMRVNDALTPEEIAEGWVLTCQAVPLTDVRVVYDP